MRQLAPLGKGDVVVRSLDDEKTVGEGELLHPSSRSGDVVALADGFFLRLVDVTDPDAPSQLSAAQTPGDVFGVAMQGTTVFVADNDEGLRILDASDPAQPTTIGALPMPDDVFRVTGSGEVMPQKSTFFYPKVPTGMVFRVHEDAS